jgi:hypothetical protein
MRHTLLKRHLRPNERRPHPSSSLRAAIIAGSWPSLGSSGYRHEAHHHVRPELTAGSYMCARCSSHRLPSVQLEVRWAESGVVQELAIPSAARSGVV